MLKHFRQRIEKKIEALHKETEDLKEAVHELMIRDVSKVQDLITKTDRNTSLYNYRVCEKIISDCSEKIFFLKASLLEFPESNADDLYQYSNLQVTPALSLDSLASFKYEEDFTYCNKLTKPSSSVSSHDSEKHLPLFTLSNENTHNSEKFLPVDDEKLPAPNEKCDVERKESPEIKFAEEVYNEDMLSEKSSTLVSLEVEVSEKLRCTYLSKGQLSSKSEEQQLVATNFQDDCEDKLSVNSYNIQDNDSNVEAATPNLLLSCKNDLKEKTPSQHVPCDTLLNHPENPSNYYSKDELTSHLANSFSLASSQSPYFSVPNSPEKLSSASSFQSISEEAPLVNVSSYNADGVPNQTVNRQHEVSDKFHSEEAVLIKHEDESYPCPDVKINTEVAALVPHIMTPSDFWLQHNITQFHELNGVLLPLQRKSSMEVLPESSIVSGKLCFVPYITDGSYYRALILDVITSENGEKHAKIFFVDYGNTEIVPASSVRVLPEELKKFPAQAIHCFLRGITSFGETWSVEAIQEFQTVVRTPWLHAVIYPVEKYSMYPITLQVKIPFPEDTTLDVAKFLCCAQLAKKCEDDQHEVLSDEEMNATLSSGDCSSFSPVTTCHPSDSSSLTPENSNREISKLDESGNTGTSLQEKGKSLAQNEITSSQISGASNSLSFKPSFCKSTSESDYSSSSDEYEGISRNDGRALRNSPLHCVQVLRSDNLQNCGEPLCEVSTQESCDKDSDRTNDLNSANNNSAAARLEKTVTLPSDIIDVSKPLLALVSEVVSPGEFYVNIINSDSDKYDILQHEMKTFYSKSKVPINKEQVQVNSFWSCRFTDDDSWYRVKVLKVWETDDDTSHAVKKKDESNALASTTKMLVHYVDYGDKEVVDISEIQPLHQKFAVLPPFVLCCSLAHLFPVGDHVTDSTSHTVKNVLSWPENAVNRFQEIVKDENHLTMEVVLPASCPKDSSFVKAEDVNPLPVLLYVSKDNQDILVNHLLAEEGLAGTIKPEWAKNIPNSASENSEDAELSQWNPMEDVFYSDKNSFGVDTDDPEIATTGHKAKDEQYICKFYSNRGQCWRKSCPYLHIEDQNRDITRDVENESYNVLNYLELPDVGSRLIVQVSSIYTPTQFYLIFPYGPITMEDLNFCPDFEDPQNEECLETIQKALNEHYSTLPFNEDAMMALSIGKTVVAKSEVFNHWCRADILDDDDIDSPVEVMFIDYGTYEKVRRKNIREIMPEFLHLPVQAVKATIPNLQPIMRSGKDWDEVEIKAFKNIVENKMLVAHLIEKTDDYIAVDLFVHLDGKFVAVSEQLISVSHSQM